MSAKNEWIYFDETVGDWKKDFISLDELARRHAAGEIDDATPCVSQLMLRRGPRVHGIPYSSIVCLPIVFSPAIDEFYESRLSEFTTVLCGPNNSGKTLLLKQLFALVGEGGYLVSCNRFSHIDVLNTREQQAAQYRNYYTNFVQGWHTSRQNTEDSEFKLEQAITGLSNSQRTHLFSLCEDILGNRFSLRRTQENNDFSPFYVDMDGENLRYGSSGTRLLLTILGTVLNDKFSTLLIDEPEIGLSPRSQSALAALFFEPRYRATHWPHLQHLYIATHSHLFLDRRQLSSNHIVRKRGDTISIKAVASIGDFHQLQFNMLGNEFESVFLPSAIVIVEGDSDVTFLDRLMSIHVPKRKIAIVRAHGDGGVLDKLHVLEETFGNISSSPYRDRILVAIDQRHSLRIDRVAAAGAPPENIFVWSRNGIEYHYPKVLVGEVFRCATEDVELIPLECDPVEFNGIRLSKRDLAQIVSDRVTSTHALSAEMANLVRRIQAICA